MINKLKYIYIQVMGLLSLIVLYTLYIANRLITVFTPYKQLGFKEYYKDINKVVMTIPLLTPFIFVGLSFFMKWYFSFISANIYFIAVYYIGVYQLKRE